MSTRRSGGRLSYPPARSPCHGRDRGGNFYLSSRQFRAHVVTSDGAARARRRGQVRFQVGGRGLTTAEHEFHWQPDARRQPGARPQRHAGGPPAGHCQAPRHGPGGGLRAGVGFPPAQVSSYRDYQVQ